MSDPTPDQKLYKKLFNARKAAEAVTKHGHNKDGDFYFARFEDVLAEAERHLEKQRILIVPQVVGEELKFSAAGFAIATVVMEFEVIDTTGGGKIVRRWSGTGHDAPGDKALFKAQTGCEKYFLAKLLGIPFGTDPEAEAEQHPSHSEPEPGESIEAEKVRDEQDRAAEAPQLPPRHEKPLPKSSLEEPDWEGLSKEVPASV